MTAITTTTVLVIQLLLTPTTYTTIYATILLNIIINLHFHIISLIRGGKWDIGCELKSHLYV